MHLGHLYLAISLVALGMIGIFHKVADQYRCRPPAVSVTMFFWAGLLSLTYLLFVGEIDRIPEMPSTLYLVAGVCGFLAATAVVTFQAGLRYGEGKIATSWVVINLSTALPTVLSIIVYKEEVSLTKIAGLVMVVVAVLLLWKDKQIDEMASARESTSEPASADRPNFPTEGDS